MKKFVRIKNGIYRGQHIHDEVFPLVFPVKQGKYGLFVTVDASEKSQRDPLFFKKMINSNPRKIRVNIAKPSSVTFVTKDGLPLEENISSVATDASVEDNHEEENFPTEVVLSKPVNTETKEEARERIKDVFQFLDEMTKGATNGTIRGMIVCGPPGIGKTYGIEHRLDIYQGFLDMKAPGHKKTVTIIKGRITPVQLYRALYNASAPGSVVLFDDCDNVLEEDTSLNMLKAVLDSGKRRVVSWMSNSRDLKEDGIPDRFDFKGSCIFVTNINLTKSASNSRSSKRQDHLAAILSRCHHIDLAMKRSDIFLRIEQIAQETDMLSDYEFGDEGNQEIIDFMRANENRLLEVSLRTVLKIADLKKLTEDNWKKRAEITCMKRVF